MNDDDVLPHVGDRPEWGYMNSYEWNGEAYEAKPCLDASMPQRWDDQLRPDDWRAILLELMEQPSHSGIVTFWPSDKMLVRVSRISVIP